MIGRPRCSPSIRFERAGDEWARTTPCRGTDIVFYATLRQEIVPKRLACQLGFGSECDHDTRKQFPSISWPCPHEYRSKEKVVAIIVLHLLCSWAIFRGSTREGTG
jgi:hypothetical protein